MTSINDEINKEIDKIIEKIIFETHAHIVEHTPVDTGRLRSSISIEKDTDGNWFIGTNVDYAEYVELGSKPHKITPKEKKALKFKIGGKDIFAKSVQHPGTTGHGMFKKGVLKAETLIKEHFKR
jgi:hypothetical protein